MAIRIRKINNITIAICAAISTPKPDDLYLDDAIHHALSTKFMLDFCSEGLEREKYLEGLPIDNELELLMRKEQKGLLV